MHIALRFSAHSLLVLTLAQLPGLAHAQIYMCKDAAGRTITSDRPIPECALRPMRELGNNGVTLREIPAPLTAEQKYQKQLAAERQKADAAAALEVRRRDMAILERFRSEREIEFARKRAISGVEEKIRSEQLSYSLAEKQFGEASRDAERYRRNGVLPAFHVQKVERARDAVQAEQQLLIQHKHELLKVDAWFDDTLMRFRELSKSVSLP
ncbi:DUF4124 domain-containing protein [Actimicrobium antarcticum]|uniref:DUF4124 domain-containing protein n=1 Tax=Actimicrobium antarcticum TaxID=1051899 RepID=A0ABP7T604_9BURK